MKAATVSSREIAHNRYNLLARRYLDRCKNCGQQEKDHVAGQCGQYKRVFVELGTNFEHPEGVVDYGQETEKNEPK